MKKKLITGGIIVVIIGVLVGIFTIFSKGNQTDNKGKTPSSNENNSNETLKKLPLPELTGGIRGELGIDKNINEQTIDEYLNRSDSVYRDMRLLDDPGNYESIGGDSKLSGYIKGFKVIPLPYIIPVSGLPESVGNTYQGTTLFSVDSNGKYIPNYEESMSIIEEYFPKDKYIFLMCGGGGYAGMMKNFLVSLGWDTNKIYNIGGYWYYDGKNNVEVKKVINGKISYEFDSVPYISIDFSKLHKLHNINSNQTSNRNSNKGVSNSNVISSNITSNKKNDSNLPINLDKRYYSMTKDTEFDAIDLVSMNDKCLDIDSDKEPKKYNECFANLDKGMVRKANVINKLIDNKASFILAISPGDVCYGTMGTDVLSRMDTFSKKYNIYYYYVSMGVFKHIKLYSKTLKYAPTVIIVDRGKVIAYVNPNDDSSIKLNKDDRAFEKWMLKYVNVK